MDDGIARMGEVVFSSPSLTLLKALGLGSCIGLCVYDPSIKLACIAHIMLPEAKTKNTLEIGKYANTAVPYVIEQMVERGASKHRLKVAMTGGAQLFSFEGMTDRLDVGRRNIEAVLNHLNKANVKMLASDVGGKSGRTVTLNAKTGEMIVKQVGGSEKELINFQH